MSSGTTSSAISAPRYTPLSGVDRNQEATVYVANLDEKVTDELLWELFVQVGPVSHVHIPRDRVTLTQSGYGFVEFQSEQDAEYAVRVLSNIKLFGKSLRVNKASQDKQVFDVGANLFIGNLDVAVDERLLIDTFSAFGRVLQAKVGLDGATGNPKGFGFVNFDSFEAADAAIEAMNGQYLCNRPIAVNYAFKKDGKAGERHGTAAERLLAAQAKKNSVTASVSPSLQQQQLLLQQQQALLLQQQAMQSMMMPQLLRPGQPVQQQAIQQPMMMPMMYQSAGYPFPPQGYPPTMYPVYPPQPGFMPPSTNQHPRQ